MKVGGERGGYDGAEWGGGVVTRVLLKGFSGPGGNSRSDWLTRVVNVLVVLDSLGGARQASWHGGMDRRWTIVFGPNDGQRFRLPKSKVPLCKHEANQYCHEGRPVGAEVCCCCGVFLLCTSVWLSLPLPGACMLHRCGGCPSGLVFRVIVGLVCRYCWVSSLLLMLMLVLMLFCTQIR